MKKLLISILSRFDRQTASEWRGLIQARTEKPLNKRIEFAFSIADENGNHRRFYTWVNPLDRPPKRTITWGVRMAELGMGIDRETLGMFIDEMNEILSGKGGAMHIGKIANMVYAIETRMNLAPFEDHLYWSAAVEFFELHEDLEDFIFEEQEHKIKLWKASMPSANFFLQPPFQGKLLSAGQLLQDLATKFKMQELELRAQGRSYPFLHSGRRN